MRMPSFGQPPAIYTTRPSICITATAAIFRSATRKGRKIFWGRGNGWVFAGLARILNDLPAHHPSRPRYEALFKQMAARLVGLQGRNGYWPVSLLEPQDTPETSGTGFFVYGLAWGVNHGLLPERRYRQSIDRGWRALVAAVHAGWQARLGAAHRR